ncbi:hypothetical protein BX600DRAFT_531718 [Xylariales sp. PMI_506]|nr:hypothetical protein BX600DRAFT_531718 [Xylariales sp. PMI_506]
MPGTAYITRMTCARQDSEGKYCCDKEPRVECSFCGLANYCSRICMDTDQGSRHQQICKIYQTLSHTVPMETANIEASSIKFPFMNNTLFSSVPAVNILDRRHILNSNSETQVLLTASGDLSSVIKTVADIPSDTPSTIHLTVNDRDPNVASRNLIILLACIYSQNVVNSAEAITHYWYSAFLPDWVLDVLQTTVGPTLIGLAQEASSPMFPPHDVIEFRLPWGRNSEHILSIALLKSVYLKLPSLLEKRPAFQHGIASKGTVTDQTYLLYRNVSNSAPNWRFSKAEYLRNGTVQPLCADHRGYMCTNPSFSAQGAYSNDDRHPVDGWDIQDILKTKCHAPSNDLYGKFFYYMRQLVVQFIFQLTKVKVEFTLTQWNFTRERAKNLAPMQFDVIDVSNMQDLMDATRFTETLSTIGSVLCRPQGRIVCRMVARNQFVELDRRDALVNFRVEGYQTIRNWCTNSRRRDPLVVVEWIRDLPVQWWPRLEQLLRPAQLGEASKTAKQEDEIPQQTSPSSGYENRLTNPNNQPESSHNKQNVDTTTAMQQPSQPSQPTQPPLQLRNFIFGTPTQGLPGSEPIGEFVQMVASESQNLRPSIGAANLPNLDIDSSPNPLTSVEADLHGISLATSSTGADPSRSCQNLRSQKQEQDTRIDMKSIPEKNLGAEPTEPTDEASKRLDSLVTDFYGPEAPSSPPSSTQASFQQPQTSDGGNQTSIHHGKVRYVPPHARKKDLVGNMEAQPVATGGKVAEGTTTLGAQSHTHTGISGNNHRKNKNKRSRDKATKQQHQQNQKGKAAMTAAVPTQETANLGPNTDKCISNTAETHEDTQDRPNLDLRDTPNKGLDELMSKGTTSHEVIKNPKHGCDPTNQLASSSTIISAVSHDSSVIAKLNDAGTIENEPEIAKNILQSHSTATRDTGVGKSPTEPVVTPRPSDEPNPGNIQDVLRSPQQKERASSTNYPELAKLNNGDGFTEFTAETLGSSVSSNANSLSMTATSPHSNHHNSDGSGQQQQANEDENKRPEASLSSIDEDVTKGAPLNMKQRIEDIARSLSLTSIPGAQEMRNELDDAQHASAEEAIDNQADNDDGKTDGISVSRGGGTNPPTKCNNPQVQAEKGPGSGSGSSANSSKKHIEGGYLPDGITPIRPGYTIHDLHPLERSTCITWEEATGRRPPRPVPWTAEDWAEHDDTPSTRGPSYLPKNKRGDYFASTRKN